MEALLAMMASQAEAQRKMMAQQAEAQKLMLLELARFKQKKGLGLAPSKAAAAARPDEPPITPVLNKKEIINVGDDDVQPEHTPQRRVSPRRRKRERQQFRKLVEAKAEPDAKPKPKPKPKSEPKRKPRAGKPLKRTLSFEEAVRAGTRSKSSPEVRTCFCFYFVLFRAYTQCCAFCLVLFVLFALDQCLFLFLFVRNKSSPEMRTCFCFRFVLFTLDQFLFIFVCQDTDLRTTLRLKLKSLDGRLFRGDFHYKGTNRLKSQAFLSVVGPIVTEVIGDEFDDDAVPNKAMWMVTHIRALIHS